MNYIDLSNIKVHQEQYKDTEKIVKALMNDLEDQLFGKKGTDKGKGK